MTVALVVVSHSALIARGVQELAIQLAPAVRLIAAGGTESGEIGTSFDLVLDALTEASNPDGVAVLADIGSAVVLAHGAITYRNAAIPVRFVQAPLVEGAVAAAVAAQSGADLDSVVKVAERAGRVKSAFSTEGPVLGGDAIARQLKLRDGLHARPAAALALIASRFDAIVTVDGADAASVLDIMALGLGAGEKITIMARGIDADAAIEAIAIAVADGFE